MVDDESIDFAFSADSLVHADLDVIAAYLSELARTLRPNGVGFIHHSNLGAPTDLPRARAMLAAREATPATQQTS